MKKMKILLIIALLLVGAIFSLHADIAKNIQGKILVWDGYQWEPAAYEVVTVILYYDEAHGSGEWKTKVLETSDIGNYSWDFPDPDHNHEWCDRIVVIFRGEPHWSSYDGIERIDIGGFSHPKSLKSKANPVFAGFAYIIYKET